MRQALVLLLAALVVVCIRLTFFKLSPLVCSAIYGNSWDSSRKSPLSWHPIPHLMSSAEANFTKMISRQSKTLGEAVAEYRRRYHRDPPTGFDDWFAFAIKNNARVIDEYDSMVNDFSPFWNLTGEELRRRALQIGQFPSVDLLRLKDGDCFIANTTKNFNDSEQNARARGFRSMIRKFQHKLPNMDFPINTKAEGRILVPWEHRMYSEFAFQDASGDAQMLNGGFVPDWKNDGNVWEAFRRTCHPSAQARRLFGSISMHRSSNLGIPTQQRILLPSSDVLPQAHRSSDFEFVPHPDYDFDFCSHPSAHYQQGHFFSDWRTISKLYPMFSPSKAPGFSDILIPSHYYYGSSKKYTYGWDPEHEIIHETDKSEVAWENKTNKIFWRGATTGGGSAPPGYLTSYQRHRFIEMAASDSNVSKIVHFANPYNSAMAVKVAVPLNILNNDIMDTAFTKAVGCTRFPGGCKALQSYYRFADPVPMGDFWQHKYLVDIDGMGYSARSMALLASESALVKSTVYREFFTDWIQPWLHYIPLSMTYKELYNIHAFFSGPSPLTVKFANMTSIDDTDANQSHGDKLLQQIARAGREWKRTMARKIDMEVYVYRLCLEYARLWADDRNAMSYTGP